MCQALKRLAFSFAINYVARFDNYFDKFGK